MVDVSDFFSDFECAYLGDVKETSPGTFNTSPQSRDEYGQQGSLGIWVCGGIYLAGNMDSAARIEITDASDADLIPCYSPDRRRWNPVPTRRSSFDFDLPLPDGWNEVYFATAYPYTFSQELRHTGGLSESPHASVDVLGRTSKGRDIHALTIGDVDADCRAFIQTGLHGAETASIYGVEGMIDHLVSGRPEATEMLDRTAFKIVPMLNVDAQYLGLDRRNANGINLFYDWGPSGWDGDDPSIPVGGFSQAETCLVRDAVLEWEPDVFIDLHSWHFAGDGFWGPDPVPSSPEVTRLRDSTSSHLHAQHFFERGAISNPASYIAVELSIPTSTTELALGFDSRGRPKTPGMMREQGVQVLRGVCDYLNSRKS